MEKECPRCKGIFECKNDNIMECECISVIISAETYQYVGENYSDCLCTKCLYEIEKEQQCSPKLSAVPSN